MTEQVNTVLKRVESRWIKEVQNIKNHTILDRYFWI